MTLSKQKRAGCECWYSNVEHEVEAMKPQIEGRVWQVLGLLVVIGSALEIRSARQQFAWILTQSTYAGYMDLVWPCAMGVFAGFLFLAGASAIISGCLLRVMNGSRHHSWIWKVAGLFCCLGGMVIIVLKMTDVALSRGVRIAEAEDFFHMVANGDFAIAMSGGYVFMLGIMLIMADRLGSHLRLPNTARVQRG